MKPFAMLLVVLTALVDLPCSAQAQSQDLEVRVTVVGHMGIVSGSPSDHFLTFSGPVQVPGVGLAPGAYIFRLITPSVMQVLPEDRSAVYAMFLVLPASRSETSGDYVMTLRRIREDAPARITKMFLPNALTGYELAYPRSQIATVIDRLAMK